MTDARPSRLRLRGLSLKREQPAYSVSFAGADAVQRLHRLTQPDAERLLSVCAVSLSLYPAWERRDWVMPDPEAAVRVHGGHFLDLSALAMRLGGVQHEAGRHSYLHGPSGLAFAAHQDAAGQVTLVLGGTNSSHTDSQPRTFPAEVQQLQADVLNVVGRVPRLYRTADTLALLLRDELARERHGHPPGRRLMLTGHSLGGGLAQYAGLMNGLDVLAFSPAALGRGVLALLDETGRLNDPARVRRQVRSVALSGDPVPTIGNAWLQSSVVGEHLRLPLAPDLPRSRYASSHGQIYPHLLAHLRERWPDLPDAVREQAQTPTPDETARPDPPGTPDPATPDTP